MDWQTLVDRAEEIALELGPRLLAAAGILLGGWIASKIARGLLCRLMEKARLDPTLVGFFGNIIYAAMIVFVFVSAIQTIGVPTASLVAAIGAAGLAVGFALQGSLSNFAAGIMIILFRPFRAGDVIEAAGVIGTVEEIQIFATRLRTGDAKRIIVPNTALTSGTLTNYSANPNRRVDLVFGISYGDDIDKAKAVVREVLDANPKVLKDPAPVIAVGQLADSSVNLFVRPWVKSTEYWPVLFELNEAVKKAFDKQGVTIPFPQRDVHLHQVA